MLLRAAYDRLSPAGERGRLLILAFGRVAQRADPLAPPGPDAADFERQMTLLRDHFNVLPLSEAAERLRRRRLPARCACVTFDGGYEENLRTAVPILQRLRLPATWFVAAGHGGRDRPWGGHLRLAVRRAAGAQLDLSGLGLGRHDLSSDAARAATLRTLVERIGGLPADERRRLSARVAQAAGVDPHEDLLISSDDIRQLARAGLEIGARGHADAGLAHLAPEQAREEIAGSRHELESITGAPVRAFAYPDGRPGRGFGPEHVDLVREAGYACAVTTVPGVAHGGSDLLQLPRLAPGAGSRLRFAWRLLRELRGCRPGRATTARTAGVPSEAAAPRQAASPSEAAVAPGAASACGLAGAPGLSLSPSLSDASGLGTASGLVTASGSGTASGLVNASGLATMSGLATTPGLANASGLAAASGLATASGLAEAPGLATASGLATSSAMAALSGVAATPGLAMGHGAAMPRETAARRAGAPRRARVPRVMLVEEGIGFGGAAVCAKKLMRHADRWADDCMVVSTVQVGLQEASVVVNDLQMVPREIVDFGPLKARLLASAPGRVGRLLLRVVARLDDLVNFGPRVAMFVWLMLRYRPDVVHTNNEPFANRMPCIAARLLGIPVVSHVRGEVAYMLGKHRWSLSMPSHVVAVSAWLRDELVGAGISPERCHLIYDGLTRDYVERPSRRAAARQRLGVDDSTLVITLVGMLVAWKGQALAIDALERIAHELPDFRLVFVGASPNSSTAHEQALRERAARSALSRHIVFAGLWADTSEAFDASDIVLSTSLEPEPFGLVVLEAIGRGRAVAAPAWGGAAEVIEHRVSGLLYEPCDAGSLAEAIRELALDEPLRRRLGEAGRVRAQTHFDDERNLDRMAEIYRATARLA